MKKSVLHLPYTILRPYWSLIGLRYVMGSTIINEGSALYVIIRLQQKSLIAFMLLSFVPIAGMISFLAMLYK